jgi:p-cumate 2,3-dioxygenase beta subunit
MTTSEANAVTTPLTAIENVERPQVEDLLFLEAQLLDEWRLDDWLELYTET